MKIVSARVTDQSEQALGLSDLCLPLGRSEAMRRVHDHIRRLAATDTTTLIYGETGTGKELVAAALHRLSRRGSGPYLCVNCGGLPDGLVESELFGHVRGAFTGAFQERTGRFEAAHGGSLFLDEIGDTSPATQIRLLRILETKCVEPVGSHRARKVDVRILAATNKPLGDEVGAGRFRNDLYYRLNVAMIEHLRSASGARTSRSSPAISWTSMGIVHSKGQRRSAPRPWSCSCTMTGRETCVSYGTPLNTRSSKRKRICSGPPICHRS